MGVQVPPISGVPPKLLNKFIGVSLKQSSAFPLFPASLASVTETVMVAVLLLHIAEFIV